MKISKTQQGLVGVIILVAIAILLVGGIFFALNNKIDEPISIINPTPTPSLTASPTPTDTANSTTVKIALLAPSNGGQTNAGCDNLAYKNVTVPKTTAVLEASMKALFEDNTKWPPSPEGAPGNFVGAQPNLTFDKVSLETGVAKVYLKGNVSLGGVCDDPRLEAQVNATAKQFPTVSSVKIYVNDKLWTTPSERG